MNSLPETQPSSSENPSTVTATDLPQTGSSSVSELTEEQLDTTVKAALKLLNKGDYEECLNTLEETLKKAEKVHGESSFEAARLHFELGSALLQKVETVEDEFEDVSDTEEGKDDEEGKEENVEGEDAENKVEDLQVAWEHMEVARVFLEKLLKDNDSSDADTKHSEVEKITKIKRVLAQVMIRLGDAHCFSEKFDDAIGDYEKGLQLRKEIEDKLYSRDLAEIYYLLGNAYLYKNADTCGDVALGQLNRARVILENVLYKLMGSGAAKDPEDIQSHTTFMSKEFLKPSIFETDKIKDLKETVGDLYKRIDDIKEKEKKKEKPEKAAA